ncbi:BglG family transcription antiterminator [Macrococcus armenti]|uniref:BglG family transcription antiterminator n=1 Tax=Macrococcus armenti TaxID=2875764 RepID=UPI001CCADED6|nr:transcription antiterminator [Macrococcus armenti]UBH08999.1 transcription antiterminator [Macrococcus armenti]UBH11290.1 transcription antiterminator [Macrococcus armenti]
MQISNREKKIIESLLKNPHSFLSIHYIAQALGVSSRTVHRELKFVEATLERFNITLERVPHKGLKLNGNADDFETLIEQLEQQKTIDLSVEERKVIIVYALIKSKDPVKLYSLAYETGISINKLNKELESLEKELSRYHLKLIRKRGEGIILMGSEVNRRQYLADLMLQKLNATSVYSVIEDHFVYQTLNDKHMSQFVDVDQIFNVERLLMDALIELPYVLTETAYLTLTLHIALAIERIQNNESVTVEREMINALSVTPEFRIAEQLCRNLENVYEVQFDIEEKVFITMHLRGAKRKADESETNVCLNDEVSALIEAVTSYTPINIQNSKTLFDGLVLHLVPALNRISGGIETFNPLTEMIKEDYPEIFNAVLLGLQEVFPDLQFPESEIAFIALHFGGASRKQDNILVVCTSGIGTSRILASKIESTFPQVSVAKIASVSELRSLNLAHYDYIVSTVALDTDYPYSVVNPLLPESDQALLSQYFTVQHVKKEHIDQYTPIDYDDFVRLTIDGNALIQDIQFVKMKNDDFVKFASALMKDNVNDLEYFQEALTYRNHLQGFLITDSTVAIPHIVHESIRDAKIILAYSDQGVHLKNMDGEIHKANYLVYMFLPEDTVLRPLISELSLLVMEYVSSPETLFNDKNFVVEYMKAALMKQLSKQIKTME